MKCELNTNNKDRLVHVTKAQFRGCKQLYIACWRTWIRSSCYYDNYHNRTRDTTITIMTIWISVLRSRQWLKWLNRPPFVDLIHLSHMSDWKKPRYFAWFSYFSRSLLHLMRITPPFLYHYSSLFFFIKLFSSLTAVCRNYPLLRNHIHHWNTFIHPCINEWICIIKVRRCKYKNQSINICNVLR